MSDGTITVLINSRHVSTVDIARIRYYCLQAHFGYGGFRNRHDNKVFHITFPAYLAFLQLVGACACSFQHCCNDS